MTQISSTSADLRRGVDHIGVGCVFFCHDGQGNVLLHKRSVNCRDEQGRWDCGAGAMEFGESFEETLKREIMEEYCAEPIRFDFVTFKNSVRDNAGATTHWVHAFYLVELDPAMVRIGDPQKMEEIGWFPMEAFPEPMHTNLPHELEMVQTFLKSKHQ